MHEAALGLYAWLAGSNHEDAILSAATGITRNALQAVTPGAADPASAHKCDIICSSMELVWQCMAGYIPPPTLEGLPVFLASPALAGASSHPRPLWLSDAVELAIRILEHIGEPRWLRLSLPTCLAVRPCICCFGSVCCRALAWLVSCWCCCS
jgi:hypothetical protein